MNQDLQKNVSTFLNASELVELNELQNRLNMKTAPILRIALKFLHSMDDGSIREMINVLTPRVR